MKFTQKGGQSSKFSLFLVSIFSYFHLVRSISVRHNLPVSSLKNLSSPKVPGKIKHIVGKTRQKQMYLIGKRPYIPGLCPIKIQAKYPKDSLHFAPDPRKYLIETFAKHLFLRPN